MTAPTWQSIADETADLLTLIADIESPVGRDVPSLFLDACELDARMHGGLVSVNRVRAALSDADIPPRRYSALWAHFTGAGKPMVKAKDAAGLQIWEVCEGSASGNDGRPFPLRRWAGTLKTCKACHGKGQRLHGWAICPKACEDCGGTGEVRR